MIRTCRPEDAARICEIYNRFVRDTIVTFEEEPISASTMATRIDAVTREYPWLVWEEAQTIVGYAYATAWKPRSAYRRSVESTIYLDDAWYRRGIGSSLYGALVSELRERGFHCVVGGIALPNEASVALHEKLGFTMIGQFRDIGYKLGRFIDVGYWELMLRDHA